MVMNGTISLPFSNAAVRISKEFSGEDITKFAEKEEWTHEEQISEIHYLVNKRNMDFLDAINLFNNIRWFNKAKYNELKNNSIKLDNIEFIKLIGPHIAIYYFFKYHSNFSKYSLSDLANYLKILIERGIEKYRAISFINKIISQNSNKLLNDLIEVEQEYSEKLMSNSKKQRIDLIQKELTNINKNTLKLEKKLPINKIDQKNSTFFNFIKTFFSGLFFGILMGLSISIVFIFIFFKKFIKFFKR